MSDDWTRPGGQPQGQPPGQQQPWQPPQWQQPRQAAKPGVIPLRPLGVGEVLDGAISFVRSNPVATIGLSAVVVAITQLVSVVVVLATGGTRIPSVEDALQRSDTFFTDFAPYLRSALIGEAVGFLTGAVLAGVLVVVLSQAVLGKKMGIAEAWKVVRGRVPGLIGIGILKVLGMAAVLAVGFLPGTLAALAGANGGVAGLLLVVGMLAAVGGVVYLWVSWALIGPVYVLEHAAPLAAFRRSRALVAPQWGRIFGILLLGGVIATIIAGIVGAPFGIVGGLTAEGTGSEIILTPTALVLSAIGGVLGSMLTTPFLAGVTGLVYFDQRIRREALDITLQRAVNP